eukprot:Transcript_21927.p1 GENE.Transcript_21927~~Transcript_21927.p1  ORF type:complete len:387 (+),score=177.29 Transcript_21927:158-1318(+)
MPPKVTKDVKEVQIDKETLVKIMKDLDKDGDGQVDKEEFKVPWMKLFPKLTDAEFEVAWKKIDKDGDGNLSMNELAEYYGFNLSPSGQRGGSRRGSEEMSDEQILEALQLQAALDELKAEEEKKAKQKAEEEEGKPSSSPKMARRKEKSSSAGVAMVRMPAKITETCEDPNVLFLQMCELGDEKAILEALKKPEQMSRIEDEKGEMPMHKLARQGCIESIRVLIEKAGDMVKSDLNWADKQGNTPIFYAAQYGHQKLCHTLLDRGADPLVENVNGWTVLHQAVNSDKQGVVEDLLSHPKVSKDKKELLERKDKSKRVALHIAAFKSKEGDMVALLLKHGADPTATDAAGNTGAKLAGRTGRRKSKELLDDSVATALAAVSIANAGK